MSTVISQQTSTARAVSTQSAAVPLLENGDRLSREEFERRYEAMPNLKKAELIEGEVHMPSPVRATKHSLPHGQLVTLLGIYHLATPGVLVGDNGTVRLDLENELQPDAYLMIDPDHGGQATIDENDYVQGAPELVAEIASSSASIDMGKKLRVYRRNGVREYLVWRVLDKEIDWFVLRQSQYELLVAQDGLLKSEVFPGLWLDGPALLAGSLARVHDVIQQGLASPEHRDFVDRLSRQTSR